MEINEIPFDKALAVHSIALEYARIEIQADIADGADPRIGPQDWQDRMFDSYVRAFGYLSKKTDEYITLQLGNH